jgi:3-hydroxybutyryl-CoA dehydrogenase
MDATDIRTIAVVGSGFMGHGIALDFAARGYDVHLYGRAQARLEQALQTIERELPLIQQGCVATREQMDEALSHIRTSTNLEETAAGVDLVVEALAEDLPLKQEIFKQLDCLCPKATILASTTSTILPSALAAKTRQPERVIVTHYFFPPYLLPLVEIVRGPETSDATVRTIKTFYERIGKRPAVVEKEIAGFVASRLQLALVREAFSLVDNGVASPADIDAIVHYGFGRRLSAAGVFEIADMAGLELYQVAVEALFPHLESSTGVPRTLREKVARGDFGVKSGKGFYEWTPETLERERQRFARALIEIAHWDSSNEK